MSDILVPEAPKENLAPADAAAASGRARAWNLLGLVTPVANLGMRLTAPAELRWFGVGAGVILLGAAVWCWRAGHAGTATALAGAHVLLVLAGLVNPRFPEIPGALWIWFGKALGRWMAYPIFALLYFAVVTPTALLVRILGKDPIGRRAAPAESYWIRRDPAPKERFERQF